MKRTLLLVDTAHASHATRLAAMQAANQALVSYTLTDTVLALPAGDADVADFALVDCLVPDADRTGDIAWASRANEGDDYFVMELATDAEIPLIAPGLLQRSGYKGVRFVRQETSGGHGTGTGKTWRDAANGWGDTATLGATFTRGIRYYGCGCNWAIRDGEAVGSINDMPAFPTGSGETVEWRMDYSRDPGLNFMGFADITGTSDAWARPDAGSFPRLWKATFALISGFGGGVGTWLMPIDPTLSTTQIYAQHMFAKAGSQTEVENTPLSVWADGDDLWIHMPDDTEPEDRIARSTIGGYNPAQKYMDAATQKADFDFVNCQFVGAQTQAMTNGVTLLYPLRARFLGGRYLFGVSWKPVKTGASFAGCVWGRSTNGQILWDTSDRPDPLTDTYIQHIVTEHGSDQDTWNLMDRFIEIDSSKEGVYEHGGGVTNNPDDGLVSGALVRHIGIAHPTAAAKNINSDIFDDGDAHALATQGGSGWLAEFLYVAKAGVAVNHYRIDDATASQHCSDNIVRDYVIHTSNQNFASQQEGLVIGNDGKGPRTDGSGIATGCSTTRGIISGMLGDPADALDGKGLFLAIEQGWSVTEITVENCDQIVYALAEDQTDSTYQDDPAYLDNQVTLEDCILGPAEERMFWHRNANWLAEDPRPNLGYYRFNNNRYIVKSGQNPATVELWEFAHTGPQTFGEWQGNSKAAPPGALASVFDPDSTVEAEAA